MKLLVFDVEGTIFEAKYKIEGTDYSSTLWQPIAHSLGEAAEQEEKETHIKWENKEYSNYMEWVQARWATRRIRNPTLKLGYNYRCTYTNNCTDYTNIKVYFLSGIGII